MKKLSISLLCLMGSFALMQAQSQSLVTATVNYERPMDAKEYSDFVSIPTQTVTINQNSSIISHNRGISSITPYEDRAAFQAAYSETLISEDFSGGPGAGVVQGCGSIISSAGNACFGAGVLEDGFSVTMGDAIDETIYIGVGAIGNTSTLVGANAFADITIINFSPDGAYAVGADLFLSGVPNAELRVYDTSGGLIDTFMITNTPDTESFVGVISDVAIGKIEIEAENDAGELFGNLLFGTVANLAVVDNALDGFNYYPNPTTSLIKLGANKNIESVSVYNLLGQKVISNSLEATSFELNLDGLALGAYVMKVVVEGQTGTYKIIKN